MRGTRNVRPVPARFANSGPSRRTTVLVFWLERPARVVFTVLDANDGCRALGSFAYRGRAGVNRVRYRGRLDGRPLSPGRYTLVPRLYRADRVVQLERVTIQILPARAKVPLWRRTALVPAGCRGEALAGVWESASFGGSFGETASDVGGGDAAAGARDRAGGVEGAEATAERDGPALVDEDQREEGNGGLALPAPFGGEGDGPPPPLEQLAAGAILFGLGLAIMTLIVLLVRFLRGSWNP